MMAQHSLSPLSAAGPHPSLQTRAVTWLKILWRWTFLCHQSPQMIVNKTDLTDSPNYAVKSFYVNTCQPYSTDPLVTRYPISPKYHWLIASSASNSTAESSMRSLLAGVDILLTFVRSSSSTVTVVMVVAEPSQCAIQYQVLVLEYEVLLQYVPVYTGYNWYLYQRWIQGFQFPSSTSVHTKTVWRINASSSTP